MMDAVNVTVRKSADWEAVQEERDAQLRQIARADITDGGLRIWRWKVWMDKAEIKSREAGMRTSLYECCEQVLQTR